MSKSWCIVEFSNGVQIVPQLWVQGDKCFWPRFKNVNSQKLYEKAVKDYMEPDETWPLHPIRILGIYESYELAVPKLKLAEIQSDLNSDTEEILKKSRSSRKKIILSSSDEEDQQQQSSNNEIVGIKPFPKPQLNIRQSNVVFSSPNVASTSKMLDHTVHTKTVQSNIGCESNVLLSPSSTSGNQVNDGTVFQQTADCCKCCCKFDKDYKKQLSSDITDLKNQLKFILHILRDTRSAKTEASENIIRDSEEYDTKLPITTGADLNAWEKCLSVPDEQKKMLLFISRIGGYGVNNVVKNIMKKLLTDSVASLYNWEGKKQKKMFSSLFITDCIKRGALLSPNVNAKGVTEQDVIDAIKNWLRHASA